MEGQPDPEERFCDEGAKRHLAEQSERAPPTNQGRCPSTEPAIARTGRNCWRSAVFDGVFFQIGIVVESLMDTVNGYRHTANDMAHG